MTTTERPGRRKGKYGQAARTLRILEELKASPDGAPLAPLAAELGISERQLRRDLEALDEAGFTYELISIDRRAAARLTDQRGIDLRLSQRERFALLAARRVFDVLEGTPLHEDVASIYDKLTASLPEEQKKELARFGDRFVYLPDGGRKTYDDKADILNALLTGVLRRRYVRFRYRAKSGEITEGRLAPYALVLYKQGLYAIGRVEGEQQFRNAGAPLARTFALERFLEAEHVRGADFEVPEDFRVDRYFHGAFGIYLGDLTEHVIIDFRAEARELVEARTWHPSQTITRLENGGVRLELDVSDLFQVANWAIGWGPLAEVKAPPALIKRVAREHEEAAALYKNVTIQKSS